MNTPQYQPGKAWAIAAMLAVMMLTNFLDKVVLGLVAVPLMEELKLTPTEFGIIGGSFYWLYAVGAVVGGFVANRVAARRILLVMAVAWAIIQLPLAASASFLTFIACRVLLGLTEGPASPVATHALYKWFPDNKRSLPVALLHQGSSAGLLLAGLLIPAITAAWGWRANFYFLTAVGMAWCVLWYFFGAEGTVERPAAGKSEDSERIPYRKLLGDATVIGNYIAHFVAHWVLAASLTWLSAYLQKGLGFEPITAGRMFALFIAITAPVSLGLAWLSQHLLSAGVPSRLARGTFIGVALVSAGILNCSVLLFDLAPLQKFVLLAVGGGMTLVTYSVGPAILGEIVPKSQRGGILAIGNAVAALAGLCAPVLTGWLVQMTAGASGSGYERGFFFGGVILIVGGLVSMALMNPQKSGGRLWTAATRHTPA
ncbi:MFS transporter [Noviherbaspirillum denitrificans]|uniref:MFS transporter n=1 Tax=Noviherbaspirillum denitrificans TaxID=1968433 RepID=A0A254TDA4_9BURK|nr:MFS transporter [Noviherbaspirillum denitrificans]OWW20147.1 MFS transporter [Noviherbaspirillum denitrificans]